jgi:hypothetical protein
MFHFDSFVTPLMIGATKPSDLNHDLTRAYLLNRGDSTLLDQNNKRFDSFILPES